ncbi:MAG: Coenzyme F420 hydrogenase/dehydrogenase, beta subunit C-terminal domain [Desulfotignum sp.]|nr:Coenzyme F420 hydrogenase/dehydrogenase, beta subunit C-terminal domain [Desulfotignum sp.]
MTASIETRDKTVTQALQGFFEMILETGAADAVLVPSRVSDSPFVKPCLFTRPDGLGQTLPLGPGFFVNAGPMVSRLTRTPAGRKIAVWLRPCEIRAFVELTKLKQGARNELILISMDCPMALSRADYEAWAGRGPDPEDVEKWIRTVYQASGNQEQGQPQSKDPETGSRAGEWPVSMACQVCDTPWPVNADVSVLLLGSDLDRTVALRGDTQKGEAFLAGLDLAPGAEPEKRKALTADQHAAHKSAFQVMGEEIQAQTHTMDRLAAFFSACINCYNCRSVCPVCYCRECVFSTDALVHEPLQYLAWAGKWGQVPLPFDTLFFHLTRMAHIGCTCVGCGQCTLACPSHIRVADLFISVSRTARAAFDYVPGRDDAEPLPLSVFREEEFSDIVGMGPGEDR